MADRARLTDAEKKRNHIESERKRREAIRRSFDALSEVVPRMQGQARSESVMLQATVEYMTELRDRQQELREIASSMGMSRTEFEAVYDADSRAGSMHSGDGASPSRPSSSNSRASQSRIERGTTPRLSGNTGRPAQATSSSLAGPSGTHTTSRTGSSSLGNRSGAAFGPPAGSVSHRGSHSQGKAYSSAPSGKRLN